MKTETINIGFPAFNPIAGVNDEEQYLDVLNLTRADLAIKTRQFNKLDLIDSYDTGVEAAIKAAGPKGLRFTDLMAGGFPEMKLLKEAAERLVKEGKITLEKAGTTKLLKVVKTEREPTKKTEGPANTESEELTNAKAGPGASASL